MRPRPTQWKLPACLGSRAGWARLLELKRSHEPHVHQIEPTNHCPYSCIMCPRSKHMTRPQGYMDFSLYAKVVDEVAGYSPAVREKEVELFHFGESLLHPEIDRMVGYAAERGLRIVLSVNAPQLTPRLAERILRRRPFRIIVSLDGHDEETYRAIRGERACYRTAIENVDALLEVHRRVGGPTRLSVRMIRMDANEGGIADFRAQWAGRGAEVEIRDFFPWNKQELAHLGKVEKYPPHMPCPFPWQYLVVQWNGDVVPCCRDYDAANRVGNAKETTLREIWNGPALNAFRSAIAEARYGSDVCAECMAIYSDEECQEGA